MTGNEIKIEEQDVKTVVERQDENEEASRAEEIQDEPINRVLSPESPAGQLSFA